MAYEPNQQFKDKIYNSLINTNYELKKGWEIEGYDIVDESSFSKADNFTNKIKSSKTFDELQINVKASYDQMSKANNDQYRALLNDFKINRPIYASDAAKWKRSENNYDKITPKEIDSYIAEISNDVKIVYQYSEKAINNDKSNILSTITTESKKPQFETSKNVKTNSASNIIKKKASEIKKGDKIKSGFIYVATGSLRRVNINGESRYEIPCENGLGLEAMSPSQEFEIVK